MCVWAITFEAVDIETSFLVWCYILTISKSSLNIKVIGSRSRSSQGKCLFCYLDITLTWFHLSEVKVINEVKVKPRSRSFQGQIVSVWLSISKQEVGLRLKGILVDNCIISVTIMLAINLGLFSNYNFTRMVFLRRANFQQQNSCTSNKYSALIIV